MPKFQGGFFAYFLTASIYGYAISLLFGFGTHQIFLYCCAAGGLALLLRFRRGLRIDRPMAALLALVAVLTAQGYLMASGGRVDFRFLEHLLWPVAAVAGVGMLPERFGNRRQLTHKPVVAVLAVFYVVAQWLAFSIYPDKFGLFSNPHFPALYCVLTLPILFYFSAVTGGWLRWLFVLASLGDALLLLKTQSRPGFLALLAGSLVIVPFLAVRYRWMTFVAILIIPGLLYASGIYGFDARMDDLFGNLLKEERVAIWIETSEMQLASSVLEWIFGHGFGQFYRDYQAYSSFHSVVDFSFPHNFLLELLYSHGMVGLILIITAYGLFFAKLAVHAATADNSARRQVGILLIVVTTVHLVHAFLTLPFFSRSTLYPLSLVLGAGFRFFKSNRLNG
ncbi:O-antigen ligase family protein [Methylocaldum sp.]|uniref:O-antigen ligase family protein n=1 Tax=Methylocaldum sp. TaxID=1969727 RepID=UPI002D595F34|nr:O-antigen ligase family protein [Methylocaldum sp.]HYE34972.1 O-antigen ligase family protein [Methylocaldum sp.]